MEMGSYCKAYLAGRFRQFPGWHENAANARREPREIDGKLIEAERPLADDSILYLQENYVVTDSHFKDEHVIFDQVTDAWKEFCHSSLGFEVPVFQPIEIAPSPETSSSGAPS
jgi:hypothetical protein